MKNILLNFISLIIGLVVWLVMAPILSFLVNLILNIPILGQILYWPADSMWAATVIVNCGSVGAGAMASAAICKNANGLKWGHKAFCVCIMVAAIVLTVGALATGTFAWGEFSAFALSAAMAGFFWNAEREDR